jgi:hypothetical protein
MTIPPSEPPENERFRQVSQVLQALESGETVPTIIPSTRNSYTNNGSLYVPVNWGRLVHTRNDIHVLILG